MPAPINPNANVGNPIRQGNVGDVGHLLWSILQKIGTPNKNSDVGALLGSLAKSATGKQGPVNIAMLLGGGGEDLPWMEPYSLPKAMGSGQVAFREGQPYDVRGAMADAKTTALLNRVRAFTEPGRAPASSLDSRQLLHDMLFGGTTHVAPGFNIPPRP